MEIKIGLIHTARELTLNSTQSPQEIEELVTMALTHDNQTPLLLTDEKGRKFVVQADKVAYVEIGIADTRRVGFGVNAEPNTTNK